MSGGGLTLGLMKETMGPPGGGVYEAQNQVDSISRMGKAKEAKLILKVQLDSGNKMGPKGCG